MVLSIQGLFPAREAEYGNLVNGGGATKISNSILNGGWTSTTFTATKKTALIGLFYYFRVSASPAAWDFRVTVNQNGTNFNVVQITETATYMSEKSIYFNIPILLTAGDTVTFAMDYGGNMTLNFWGNVIVAEED